MKNDHDADQFARKLSDLAERPPGYKYRQLKLNHDSIERALNNGWKIADYVAALNKETDMKISVPTFKLYLHRMRKNAGMVKPRKWIDPYPEATAMTKKLAAEVREKNKEV